MMRGRGIDDSKFSRPNDRRRLGFVEAQGGGTILLARGDLELDPARRTVRRDGRDLELSPKEFGVLEALLRADGAVVSAERLLEAVWDENVDPFTNTVRMTVMKLRRKLGEPAIVHTVAGAGYRV